MNSRWIRYQMIAEAFEASIGRLGVMDAGLFAVVAVAGAFAAVGVVGLGWCAVTLFLPAVLVAWRGITGERGIGRSEDEIAALGDVNAEDRLGHSMGSLVRSYEGNARVLGIKERALKLSGWLAVGGLITITALLAIRGKL